MDKARSLQAAYDEGAEKNNAIFYAGLTEAEILHLKTS